MNTDHLHKDSGDGAERERLQRGSRNFFGLMDTCILLTVAMVSWVYVYAEIYRILPIKYVRQLYLCANYNAMKLFLKIHFFHKLN